MEGREKEGKEGKELFPPFHPFLPFPPFPAHQSPITIPLSFHRGEDYVTERKELCSSFKKL